MRNAILYKRQPALPPRLFGATNAQALPLVGRAGETALYWDEDNRLMVLNDDGHTSRYTYNAAGERVIKSHGDMEGVYINGAPQGITFHENDDYTAYPAPTITITKNRFTKHYYIGSKRVASRLGSGTFNNVYSQNGSYVTAGQKDYATRMEQIESQREDYYQSLGLPPGVPTEKGEGADPENTGVGYNTIITELGNHDVPRGWENCTPKFESAGNPPGVPVQWNDPDDTADPPAGYGFIADTDNAPEETFYYHTDHLGSTSYVTDDSARVTQFVGYLPFGEPLVDEHTSSEEMPYKFNGKELDEETGLYYYGARYYDPKTSVWLGCDPLAADAPDWTPYRFGFNNPIRYTDQYGYWEWDAVGNLKAQKGDNLYSLAKFLGTNLKNAMIILNRGGVTANDKGILNLKEGQVFAKNDLWVGFKSISGAVVNNNTEATNHYFKGNGEAADVGDISTIQLLTSDKFQAKHKKITSEKVQAKGYFAVDLTDKTFHIGRTNVDYNVSGNGKSSSVTYTLFSRDGFWDPNFVNEKTLGKVFNRYKPDGKGPNLEVLGGTPYDYKTRERTFFFKPVEDK